MNDSSDYIGAIEEVARTTSSARLANLDLDDLRRLQDEQRIAILNNPYWHALLANLAELKTSAHARCGDHLKAEEAVRAQGVLEGVRVAIRTVNDLAPDSVIRMDLILATAAAHK